MPWVQRESTKVSNGPKCPKCGRGVPRIAPPPHQRVSMWSGKVTYYKVHHSCGEELVDWEWKDDD